ncbi:hypothetical protein MGYG_04055 [Nannizzia gypsea CBS 118893]|uniref:Uncharacterized protein n=1 Tax=Arthroderma gypseum (strain ATCC MYA-4604 / CBS 118893) TaxID=535722 RepID=E4UUT5_ARTGP|nr:hypothetical protein MGYG_04055 [Nannizzia gypsea CBS 118893]EFR01052.1 hypothetical protein MGYG_04055 [Nannizzia gypsea CBS 118893]
MSQPKGMSSRLLTMKFMQRAAASGVSSNSSPAQSPPASPSGRKRAEDTSSPSSKRRKLAEVIPSEPSIALSNNSDIEAISAAIQAEDSKRSAAIARQAADAGETQWVLEYPPGTLKAATPRKSIGKIEDEEDETTFTGRKSYGGFKKKRQTETPELPETPKSDLNTGSNAEKASLSRSAKTGRISSGGGISANASNKGKNWKNRQ